MMHDAPKQVHREHLMDGNGLMCSCYDSKLMKFGIYAIHFGVDLCVSSFSLNHFRDLNDIFVREDKEGGY